MASFVRFVCCLGLLPVVLGAAGCSLKVDRSKLEALEALCDAGGCSDAAACASPQECCRQGCWDDVACLCPATPQLGVA